LAKSKTRIQLPASHLRTSASQIGVRSQLSFPPLEISPCGWWEGPEVAWAVALSQWPSCLIHSAALPEDLACSRPLPDPGARSVGDRSREWGFHTSFWSSQKPRRAFWPPLYADSLPTISPSCTVSLGLPRTLPFLPECHPQGGVILVPIQDPHCDPSGKEAL
jgi:hypothetical protein